MLYRVSIRGVTPIIQRSGTGLDPTTPANREKAEIARKRGSNRTESDDARLRELECQVSLWLDSSGRPTIPPAAIRANIEGAARKLKQGGQVREGLFVTNTHFRYDEERYGTDIATLGNTAQFTVGVVVTRNRILRTRAKFDLPWACDFNVEADEELVDQTQLRNWLTIGGSRLGLGDWRPEKKGDYGRFEIESLETENSI